MLKGSKFAMQTEVEKTYGPDVDIPPEYTKVAWVNGNKVSINTGIKAKGTLTVGLKFAYPSHEQSGKMFFGNASTTGSYKQTLGMRSCWSDSGIGIYNFFYCFASDTYYGEYLWSSWLKSWDDDVHELVMTPTQLTFDTTTVVYAEYPMLLPRDSSVLASNNMYLFSDYSSSRPSAFNCYNFYILDNSIEGDDKTVLNLVPVLDADGNPGLWDSVSKTLFQNSSMTYGN